MVCHVDFSVWLCWTFLFLLPLIQCQSDSNGLRNSPFNDEIRRIPNENGVRRAVFGDGTLTNRLPPVSESVMRGGIVSGSKHNEQGRGVQTDLDDLLTTSNRAFHRCSTDRIGETDRRLLNKHSKRKMIKCRMG